SASELGLPSSDNGGIMILPPGTPVGEDAAKLPQLFGGSDTMMEVEITPNRPDCLSHLGLARELAIRLNMDLTPAVPARVQPASEIPMRDVRIEADDACRRYLGRELSGLTVGPSPGWIVKRLSAVGQQSINNLVDL